MARVIVALSGGVDSAVSAALLQDAGHEVEALFMSNWNEDEDGYCTSAADFQDARRVAEELGIPLHKASFAAEYRARVLELLERKGAGERVPTMQGVAKRPVPSLEDALRKSLAAVGSPAARKPSGGTRRPRPQRRKSPHA